jgi:hypothetical protein
MRASQFDNLEERVLAGLPLRLLDAAVHEAAFRRAESRRLANKRTGSARTCEIFAAEFDRDGRLRNALSER